MKRCPQCGNTKPKTAFTSHKSTMCTRCENKQKGRKPRPLNLFESRGGLQHPDA